MTRVIHTGDTHLGYRQYHSPERRDDFLAAFRRVVDDAISEEVDAVVHAGDLFHDRSPSLLDVHGTIEVLRDLRSADIPFLAVVGNHERTRDGQWLDLFQTLGLATRLGTEPTVVAADDGTEDGALALYGLDYVPPSRRPALSYDFSPHDAEFAVLVAHGPFDPFVPEVRNDRWDLPGVLEAATVEFHAALLGDDHTADTVQIGETWATYCGSTERVDASEREDRGYNVVEFDGDRDGRGGVRISRRGIETRTFVLVDLELKPGEGIERVRERLREEDVEDAVVVVRIDGDGDDVHPARVEEFATERGALIARVSDRRDVATAETAPDVSFADPDEAVRERIEEMGLSEAATTIDATVRSETIADANVRDRVRERLEELLEDDPAAFERPEAGAEEADEEVETDGVVEEGAEGVADEGSYDTARGDDEPSGDEAGDVAAEADATDEAAVAAGEGTVTGTPPDASEGKSSDTEESPAEAEATDVEDGTDGSPGKGEAGDATPEGPTGEGGDDPDGSSGDAGDDDTGDDGTTTFEDFL